MPLRRIPQRRAITTPLGAVMKVRQALSPQHYELHSGSRRGQTVIGFFPGATSQLSPGDRVLGTWRQESGTFEITGLARPVAASVVSIAIGGLDSFNSTAELWLRFPNSEGVISNLEVVPTSLPPEQEINNVRFSPNGQFLACTTEFDAKLLVYSHVAGTLPTLIDTIALDDGAAAIDQYGLSWHPDGDLIAVGHDDATGDSISIFSFDGSTLALIHSEADPGGSLGCMAAEWHPDGIHLAAGYLSADVTVFSWNGSTLTSVDTATIVGNGTLQLKWSPSGDYLLEGMASNPRVRVLPWSGTVLGTPINAGVAPPASQTNGVLWYPQEDRIIVVNNNDGVTGYPWTGSAFGTRVLYTAVVRFRRDVAVDPTGTFFVTGIHGNINPDDPTYAEVFTFDGTTITRTQELGHPQVTTDDELRGYGVDISPLGAGLDPTQQVDATDITYTPTTDADWDVLPSAVIEALDEIAARVRILEP